MLLLLALVDVADGVSFFGDVDDRMRDFQIRDLLADRQWFDLTLPFINMPEAYVSPWSRLVDLPYVLITLLLSGELGQERALALSYQIWPLILLIPFALFVYGIIRQSLDDRPNFIELFTTSILMVYGVWEFVPGRIDHHNVQLLLVAAMAYGVVRWDRIGAIILALASVASIQVGLETLPIIVALFFGIVLIWVDSSKGSDGGRFMADTALSLIVSTIIITAIQPGWVNVLNVACDAYSAPYIAACLLVGSCLYIAVKLGSIVRNPLGRLLLLAGLGAALLGVLAWLFPLCLEGPYHMIDAVSRAYWLDTLTQERGILAIIGEKQQWSFAPALVVILFAPGFFILGLHKYYSGKPAWMVLCLVAMIAILLTLYQLRFFQFMVLLVPLCVPWCIRNLIVAKLRGDESGVQLSGSGMLFVIGVPLLMIAAGLGWYFTEVAGTQVSAKENDGVRYLHYDICEAELANLTYLESIKPGRIIAGDGASVAIAEVLARTKLDHKIAALAFHRAVAGIRQIAIAFTSPSKDERDKVLREFDYVAICGLPANILGTIDMSNTPLFEILSSLKSSEGFILMPAPEGTRLRIYKITAPIK